MPSPSKQKGSSFERDIAKFLSDLYGSSFIRAPGSGAYVGGTNQKRKEFLHEGQIRSFKGDIVPGQEFPKFNAECKSYKNFEFHQLLMGESKVFDKWIEQMLDVADEGDFSILFMKFNRKGKYIATRADAGIVSGKNFLWYHSEKHGSWIIQEFEQFWKLNKTIVMDLSR